MDKKVSVIIPVYNSGLYIERCLKSIINQTYKNIEIIVVDDGSTDNSLDIIKKFSRINTKIFYYGNVNKGVSFSRNFGIEHSSGQYVMFVDSDDWLENDMIEKMLTKIVEENVDVVRCNYFRNYNDNTQKPGEKYDLDIVNKRLEKNFITERILKSIIDGSMPAYTWLLIIRKEILLSMELFDENLAMMEDTVFYFNLIFKINSLYIYDKMLYHYYCNNGSASKSKEYIIRNYKNILLVNDLEKNILKRNMCSYKKNIKEIDTMHAYCIENICYNLYKNYGDFAFEKIDDIVNNEKAIRIISNSDLGDKPLNKKIALVYIKNKKIKKLINYYKVINQLAKLKDIFLKRKE